MPYHHSLQSSRYELKYLIDETRARAVRDYTRCHLVPDAYALHNPNHEYAVHSLYLDSPDLALCRATRHGQPNRFKLRVRFYDEDPDTPVFFEIKRRLDRVIHKRRAAVDRRALPRLLAGMRPSRSDLRRRDSGEFGVLDRFGGLCHAIGAEGRVFVSYLREAYVTPRDNSIRVTFDRQLTARRFGGALSLEAAGDVIVPRVGGVVLEVKFTDRVPRWVPNMARMFDLQRCSFAKYVVCVRKLPRPGALQWRMRRAAPAEVHT